MKIDDVTRKKIESAELVYIIAVQDGEVDIILNSPYESNEKALTEITLSMVEVIANIKDDKEPSTGTPLLMIAESGLKLIDIYNKD